MRSEYVLVPTVFTTRMVYLAVLTLLPFALLERGVPPESFGLLVRIYGYAASAIVCITGALWDRFTVERFAVVASLGVALTIVLLEVSITVRLLAGAHLPHALERALAVRLVEITASDTTGYFTQCGCSAAVRTVH